MWWTELNTLLIALVTVVASAGIFRRSDRTMRRLKSKTKFVSQLDDSETKARLTAREFSLRAAGIVIVRLSTR